jgi:hypothetical protein
MVRSGVTFRPLRPDVNLTLALMCEEGREEENESLAAVIALVSSLMGQGEFTLDQLRGAFDPRPAAGTPSS